MNWREACYCFNTIYSTHNHGRGEYTSPKSCYARLSIHPQLSQSVRTPIAKTRTMLIIFSILFCLQVLASIFELLRRADDPKFEGDKLPNRC